MTHTPMHGNSQNVAPAPRLPTRVLVCACALVADDGMPAVMGAHLGGGPNLEAILAGIGLPSGLVSMNMGPAAGGEPPSGGPGGPAAGEGAAAGPARPPQDRGGGGAGGGPRVTGMPPGLQAVLGPMLAQMGIPLGQGARTAVTCARVCARSRVVCVLCAGGLRLVVSVRLGVPVLGTRAGVLPRQCSDIHACSPGNVQTYPQAMFRHTGVLPRQCSDIHACERRRTCDCDGGAEMLEPWGEVARWASIVE